jgi:hypothetical protein
LQHREHILITARVAAAAAARAPAARAAPLLLLQDYCIGRRAQLVGAANRKPRRRAGERGLAALVFYGKGFQRRQQARSLGFKVGDAPRVLWWVLHGLFYLMRTRKLCCAVLCV